MRARAPLVLLTLITVFLFPLMVGSVHAASCPPGNCQITVNSNVPPSDGTIYVEVDNNTGSVFALPQTFSFAYNTTHTLTVLNSTSFTGTTTGGHYVWKDWANYYGTNTCAGGQCVWTTNPTVRICPGNTCIPDGIIYNYTGPAELTAVFDKQYRATLSFTDVSGNPLTPAPTNVTLQGPTSGTQTISSFSGQYLSADNYTVVSAYWEGTRLPPTTSSETVNLANGPATSKISLQAYPATILVVDSNNRPVQGATATVTFLNGTTTSYASNSKGQVNLGDIPGGSYGATVRYQNQTYGPYSLTAVGNPTSTITVTAGSTSTATTTAIVLLAIFGIAFFLILLAIKVRKPTAPPKIS